MLDFVDANAVCEGRWPTAAPTFTGRGFRKLSGSVTHELRKCIAFWGVVLLYFMNVFSF